jgi:hypothetical protein
MACVRRIDVGDVLSSLQQLIKLNTVPINRRVDRHP